MMHQNKSQLVFGLFFLGLILVGSSIYFSFFSGSKWDDLQPLAQIERQSGKNFLLRSGYTQRSLIQKKESLGHLDSVETSDTGEALLTFESAYKIRLLSNTLITLERTQSQPSPQILLIIKRGSISIENFGRDENLWISKNGEKVPASQYEQTSLAQARAQNPMAMASAESENQNAAQGLSEEEITTVMGTHRNTFFKCYTQLLQTDPSAKGSLSLRFQIENGGKTSSVEIAASQIDNKDFKSCLVEAVRRIQFRSFSGPVISTLFPLKFE